MFVLGIGTLLGGGGGRTQKGHGEKRSRVENYHPSRVAEAVQLLKPSVHGGQGGVRPMCPDGQSPGTALRYTVTELGVHGLLLF